MQPKWQDAPDFRQDCKRATMIRAVLVLQTWINETEGIILPIEKVRKLRLTNAYSLEGKL